MSTVSLRPRLAVASGLFAASVLAYGLVLAVLVASSLLSWGTLFGAGSETIARQVAVVVTTGSVCCCALWALYRGPDYLLAAIDAPVHEVPAEATLAGRIENHAESLDIQPPTVLLAETREPFVVTLGFRQGAMTVVVSQGLLDLLPVAELDAVLTHELGHIAHRDAQVSTALSLPIAIAERLHALGMSYWRRDRTVQNKYLGPVSSAFVLVASAMVAPLAVVCRRLRKQLVPERNIAADRLAAATTGTEPLINAIARLEDERVAGSLDRLGTSALAAFAFVPAASCDHRSAAADRGGVDQTLPGHDTGGGALGTELRRRTLESGRE